MGNPSQEIPSQTRSQEIFPSTGHIFHINDDHSPTNPGVTETVSHVACYLAKKQWRTTLLTVGHADKICSDAVEEKNFSIIRGGDLWRYPRGMRNYLKEIAKQPNCVVHIHAVWKAPQWLAARITARSPAPAVFTPHGQLQPWHWHDGRLRRLKKLIYWNLLAGPAFHRIPVIHAITPRERDFLRKDFPKQRLVLIPNALDLREIDYRLTFTDAESFTEDRPYLLFLGRLHAVKGVEILIEAFSRVRGGQRFRLFLAGPFFSPDYTERLKSRVRLLGLEDRVVFLGPVYGPRKWRLYKNAWAFCAPSFSEVMGMVNLEAAATATPVITTHETGLFDWEEGGGLLVHPDVNELTLALEEALSWSECERQERGRKLRKLVERRYSLEAVGPLWLSLYHELLESYDRS